MHLTNTASYDAPQQKTEESTLLTQAIAKSHEIEVLDRHTHTYSPTDTDIEELIHKLLRLGHEIASDHILLIGHDDVLPEALELYPFPRSLSDPKELGHYVVWFCDTLKEARVIGNDIEERIHGDWWAVGFK